MQTKCVASHNVVLRKITHKIAHNCLVGQSWPKYTANNAYGQSVLLENHQIRFLSISIFSERVCYETC